MESLIKDVEQLLTDLLTAGTWYPSALEIDAFGHEDGEELEARISQMLQRVKAARSGV